MRVREDTWSAVFFLVLSILLFMFSGALLYRVISKWVDGPTGDALFSG